MARVPRYRLHGAEALPPASSVAVNLAGPGGERAATGGHRAVPRPRSAALRRRPPSHAWQLQALPGAARGRAGTGAGRARRPGGGAGGRGTRCDAHLPQPTVDAGPKVAPLSSRHGGPRAADPGRPGAVGALGVRCARWPELSPPRRQRRPSIRAGTDATHASRPVPSPRRLLQGDTPGRWHARRRRGLKQGGDARRGGTGEPSPLPGAAETYSPSCLGPRKDEKSCASFPSGEKHIEHSLFPAHRNSRLRTQRSHAPCFPTHCNSLDSTFLPSPNFGEEKVSVFRLRSESV